MTNRTVSSGTHKQKTEAFLEDYLNGMFEGEAMPVSASHANRPSHVSHDSESLSGELLNSELGSSLCGDNSSLQSFVSPVSLAPEDRKGAKVHIPILFLRSLNPLLGPDAEPIKRKFALTQTLQLFGRVGDSFCTSQTEATLRLMYCLFYLARPLPRKVRYEFLMAAERSIDDFHAVPWLKSSLIDASEVNAYGYR